MRESTWRDLTEVPTWTGTEAPNSQHRPPNLWVMELSGWLAVSLKFSGRRPRHHGSRTNGSHPILSNTWSSESVGLPTDFLLLLLFSQQIGKGLSDSLKPHGLQRARLPCPSLSPRVCSNSCPLSPFFLMPLNFRVTYYTTTIIGRIVLPYLLISLSNKLILFHVLHILLFPSLNDF